MKVKFLFVAVIASISVFQCGLPQNPKETQWRTQALFPMGETKYSIGRQLAAAGLDHFNIDGISDSARPGDTIALTTHDSILLTFDRPLFNMDSTHVNEQLGVMTIQKSTPVHALMDFHFSGRLDSGISLQFYDTNVQTVHNVYFVRFDSSSASLPVIAKNTCAGAFIDSCTVSLFSGGKKLGEGFIPTLAPGDSVVLPMPMAGKEMDSIVVFHSVGALRGSGQTVHAGEGLDLSFCLDSMKVCRAIVIDSLLQCRQQYDKSAGLSDTFNIRYVDFDTCVLGCRFSASTPIALHVQGEMLNAWNTDFCKEKGITRLSDIGINTSATDSADTSRYRGRIAFDTLDGFKTPQLNQVFQFGPARVFAHWDGDSGRSVVQYRFTVDLVPKGRRITIDKTDRFFADVEPQRFPFVSLTGTFQYPMEQTGKPTTSATALPWKKSLIDSLRGKLQFISAQAPVRLRLDVSDSTRLDSAVISIVIKNPGATSARSYGSEFRLHNITKATVNDYAIDLTDLINDFPDSVAFSCNSVFPAGCGLFLTNDRDPKTGAYRNNLKLQAKASFSVRIPLDWRLKDTAVAILENSRGDLDSALKKFDLFKSIGIKLRLKIDNRTNLSGALYAIAATDADSTALLSLPDNKVGPEIRKTAAGSAFINLFGDNGIVIPVRDTATVRVNPDTSNVMTFSLTSADVEHIIRSRTIFIRWKLVLPKKSRDALKNSDLFTVGASFLIDGIMNPHSLVDGISGW